MSRMKLYLCCLGLVMALFCRAQHSDTLHFYYGIGNTEPLLFIRRMDSTMNVHLHQQVKISVYGYADFLGHTAGNQRLSQARADKLCQLIREKKYSNTDTIKTCSGRGDKASVPMASKLGEPYARRVDVVLLLAPLPHKIDSVAAVKTVQPQPVKQGEELKAEPSHTNGKDLADLAVGEAAAIKGLKFYGGRHILLPESKAPLLALLKTLKENPTMEVEIQGHVCCTNGDDDGLDLGTGQPNLSENRARVVYNFLVENGIDKSRLRYRGFGHAKPLVWPENTEADMQANRRVEIMVIKK